MSSQPITQDERAMNMFADIYEEAHACARLAVARKQNNAPKHLYYDAVYATGEWNVLVESFRPIEYKGPNN